MVERFPCPRLGQEVELTDERRQHILDAHVDGPGVLERLGLTLARPEVALRDRLTGDLLLARAFDFGERTRHIVGILVRDEGNADGISRLWIGTAYSARRLAVAGARWEGI